MKTRKGVSALVIILVIVGMIVATLIGTFAWYVGTMNNLVTLDENCNLQLAQVQNQYQRRYDLIPRIVNVTKLYINYETELLTEIARARSQWGEALATGDQSQMEEAATGLERVVGRLLMITVSENYPELKGDSHTLALIDELEGTENRISQERKRYNEAATKYNIAIRKFPSSYVANNEGYVAKQLFEMEAGALGAPPVNIG